MKFGVARFYNGGQFSGALNREASDEWASRFLFICLMYLIFNFDAKPHRTKILVIDSTTHKDEKDKMWNPPSR